jgi:hypothetical protein
MTLKRRLTLNLTIAIAAAAVASCATPVSTWPSAEDLRPDPKPVPSIEILTSREAGEKHDNAVEAWGERRDAAVGRLCRFFRDQGMSLPFTCPPRPADAAGS